ncbi:flippase-like domain-containing protein [Pseudoalteromonas shioyasakiensis]|uniref:lysylphosphatidylglycerol synthase transmembrane domain-containing protein n=1 Tax=Pseudoalteromonas shioyasakiensis TaxID=1190813 RepID=UPI0021179F57|nr:lysylphosphatidylglycerol synthase transmembrane domain-containing protein [Pseudoalteromonas shioyasakiensis]MCQ8879485.1 flippase-like domain-containing protein [Pseudoalteromonas shioyasakiensis]
MNSLVYFRRLKRLYLWFASSFVIYIVWNHSSDLVAAIEYLQRISFKQVILCLSLAVFSYICRSLRWLGYMRLKEHKASTKHHILIYLSGFAFTASPGKVGELMRGTHLDELGVPFRYTFLSFVSERLFDVIIVLSLGSYFLIDNFNFSLLLVTVFLLPFVLSPALKFLFNFEKSRLWHESINILSHLWLLPVVLKSYFLTLLAWILQGVILFIMLRGFGIETTIPIAISIYCLSLLIGAASLIPSGIGVTEAGMVWLLIQIGAESDIAIIAALTTRMLTLYPAMLIGLVCAFVLKNRKIEYLISSRH